MLAHRLDPLPSPASLAFARPLPEGASHLVHADWGSNPHKRWMTRGVLVDGGYRVEAPEPVGDATTLADTSVMDQIKSGLSSGKADED